MINFFARLGLSRGASGRSKMFPKEGGAALTPFWTVKPLAAVSLGLKVKTDDTLPITIDWGDGTVELLTHNVQQTHNYAGAGTYEIKFADPLRITSIVTDDTNVARYGDVDCAAFVNITELILRRCKIDSISVTTLADLAVFYCNGNQLTSIDLQSNTKLTFLYADQNYLTSIDISKNVLLETFWCNYNELTTIDVSNNPLLNNVSLHHNKLTAGTIDTLITTLNTAGLSGGTLNYDTQTGDGHLWANRSQAARNSQVNLDGKSWTITPSTPASTKIWTLAPTASADLKLTLSTSDTNPIYVFYGDGTHEYLTHGVEKTHTYSAAGSYELKIVEPTRVTALSTGTLPSGLKGTVDVSSMTNMTSLSIRRKEITSAVVSGANNLETVHLDNNALTALDISTNTKITDLLLNNNSLTAGEIDDVLTDLDAAGEVNGALRYDEQTGGTEAWASRSAGAQTAQENLEADGWTVTPAKPVLASKLLFHFDETSGTTFKEEKTGVSFSSYNVTSNINGVFNKAVLSANGGVYSDNMAVKNAVKFNLKNGFTVQGWVKTDGMVDTYCKLISVINSSYTSIFMISFKALYSNRWSQALIFAPYPTALLNWNTSSSNASPANFAHIAISYDGTYAYVAINGKIYAKEAVNSSDIPDLTSANVFVVYTAEGNNATFDEIRITDVCEYSGEVNDAYSVPSSPFTV